MLFGDSPSSDDNDEKCPFTYRLIVYIKHATGEAFIGQEKFSFIMESGFGLRKVYFITSYQNENFFPSKFFLNAVNCCKKP